MVEKTICTDCAFDTGHPQFENEREWRVHRRKSHGDEFPLIDARPPANTVLDDLYGGPVSPEEVHAAVVAGFREIDSQLTSLRVGQESLSVASEGRDETIAAQTAEFARLKTATEAAIEELRRATEMLDERLRTIERV